jgi:hypothetical protein
MGRGAYDISCLLKAPFPMEQTKQEGEHTNQPCLEAEVPTSEMHSARHVITISTRVVSSGVVDSDSGAKPIV